jgi:hypothetical protein
MSTLKCQDEGKGQEKVDTRTFIYFNVSSYFLILTKPQSFYPVEPLYKASQMFCFENMCCVLKQKVDKFHIKLYMNYKVSTG